ncbi:MAG: zinc ribbon domain-containing protein [Verrucomicrobia bacterium]|nr:zinc ribbon domain-containing protein [Verrucomicrobiota bacterium]
MPIYVYVCEDCEHRFEVLVRGEADAPAQCPKCGSSRIKKQFAAFNAASSGGASAGASCPTGTCPFA